MQRRTYFFHKKYAPLLNDIITTTSLFCNNACTFSCLLLLWYCRYFCDIYHTTNIFYYLEPARDECWCCGWFIIIAYFETSSCSSQRHTTKYYQYGLTCMAMICIDEVQLLFIILILFVFYSCWNYIIFPQVVGMEIVIANGTIAHFTKWSHPHYFKALQVKYHYNCSIIAPNCPPSTCQQYHQHRSMI